MKKAGKILAAVFAALCLVLSLLVVVLAQVTKSAQADPEAFKKRMEEVTADANVPEDDEEEIATFMESITDFFLDLDLNYGKAMSQGVVGSILSLVVLIAILINVPKMPISTPVIASIAALGGAIYCSLLMWLMVIALIGCVLVLVANLRES
ncbi:MAG: hypothetical protein F4X56_07715 [Gammaproteobacteria bacterium]|nr:hypothetical protein [Gammaproteobacteria bacterium]MYC25787.1 hypothetical protein [Gammaproteobacteria bacterium]